MILEGAPASPGVAFGPVKVVRGPEDIDLVREGDILVAEHDDAGLRAGDEARRRHRHRRGRAALPRRDRQPRAGRAVRRRRGERDGDARRRDRRSPWTARAACVYEGRADVRLAWAEEWKRRRAAMANIKTRTKVYLNLAEPSLADVMAKENVDGVGLLRAEFIVADYIKEHPRLCIDEGRPEDFTTKLAAGLRAFAQAFHPRPVVYRTTDFKTNEYRNLKGGDKYEFEEENPMIGYRGAARYIHDQDVFRLEVEAIKRVRAEFPNLWVMIPFVRTPEELAQVKALMESFGLKRSEDFKLWMMAEVPSNVFLLDKFIDVGIDGISIGSNDLTQLTLGVDRDSSQLREELRRAQRGGDEGAGDPGDGRAAARDHGLDLRTGAERLPGDHAEAGGVGRDVRLDQPRRHRQGAPAHREGGGRAGRGSWTRCGRGVSTAS